MRFTKMHGIGNDYIYVNGFDQTVKDPEKAARILADRHYGIGADGLILILPSKTADVRMRMFNADGTEGEMCGNGIRCVAKYAFDHGLTNNNPMTVETGRGVLTLSLVIDGSKVQQVMVDMGEPTLAAAEIPTTLSGRQVVDVQIDSSPAVGQALAGPWAEMAGVEPSFTCVSMGNPHLVLYCRNASKVPLETVGPLLENAAIFPRRINVHFVQVLRDAEVRIRTWERGSGITLACGTGACAVCVAGVLTGRTQRKLLAHVPGGDLSIEWRLENDHVYMTGAATEVFSGEWNAPL